MAIGLLPNIISQKAHEKPTEREAQRVRAMSPLFCEKVVLGGEPKRAARSELRPSARRPPWTREEISSASVIPENRAVRSTSPTDSAVEMRKPITMGMKYSGAKRREKVPSTHRNVMSSASFGPERKPCRKKVSLLPSPSMS